MKLFRIKEEYLITQWTYIKAESKEEATEFLNDGQSNYEREIDSECHNTYWDTLEEVNE